MWVDAEDGEESLSTYPWRSTRPVRAAWRSDAAVYWCGTARQVWATIGKELESD
jgi:hypothetical protein